MKLKNLSLENGIQREWIITNGIGGFASSTVLGINTRRYHGLLVASCNPPVERKLILSKVDESIIIDGKKYDLYANICKDYISKGYENLVEFEKNYIPIYTYKVEDVIIKKYICMEYGKNTVGIFYRIWNTNHDVKLIVTPLVNDRDFHSQSFEEKFTIEQKQEDAKVTVQINNGNSIYMCMKEAQYIKHENDVFCNMFYLEEEKRGFNPEENLAIPGRFEIEIPKGTCKTEKYEDILNQEPTKEISFIASLENDIENKDVKTMINREIARLTNLIYDSKIEGDNELIKNYIISSDNFVVYRKNTKLHTLIAGYPWFADWSRDTLISFEGILLKTKRFSIAKEVLLTIIKDVKEGLVPNGYSEYDNMPLYNSVDASLLLFEAVQKYIDYTQDINWVKEEIYPVLKEIINNYQNGIQLDGNNIYLDKEDGLISSGTPNTQNTWMDVKIGVYAVTPRNGKAVEINSLWYNALKIIEKLAKDFEENSSNYKKLADKCKKSFEEKFYNKRRKCLYDVLGDSKIRPNQLFSLSLTYPVINPQSDIAKEILETVEKKLLTPYGLKTLAKGEENYIEIYEGDSFRRDLSYHQGITWPWLLGLYNNAFKKVIQAEKAKTKKKELEEKYKLFVENTKIIFKQELREGKTIEGISELYDSKKPYESKGAFQQAWSVAEIFRIIL